MTIKTAFNSASFPEISLPQVIEKVAGYGYDAIEINAEKLPWAEPHFKPGMGVKEIEDIKTALEKFDIIVSSVSAHIDLIRKDSGSRREAVQFTKDCIDFAKELNVDICHGISGVKPDNLSDEESWQIITEDLNEIIEYAENNGIKFGFEPVAGMFINNTGQLKKLKTRITTGNLYFNYDPSHLVVEGDNLDQVIIDNASDIIRVHLKDGKGIPEKFEYPPLGEGDINFEQMIDDLKKINYEGYISIEYEAHVFGYSDDMENMAIDSLSFLKNLLK